MKYGILIGSSPGKAGDGRGRLRVESATMPRGRAALPAGLVSFIVACMRRLRSIQKN